MYRRIMVTVDGSATSKLGLHEALKLAQSDGARLRVVNVVDESMAVLATPFMPELIDALKESGTKALKEAAIAAAKKHVKAECTQRESFGRPVSDVILAEAKKWRADLLVMGTHGRRGINRLLLGSDAERVLRDAPAPVLLVRGDKAAGLKIRRGRNGIRAKRRARPFARPA